MTKIESAHRNIATHVKALREQLAKDYMEKEHAFKSKCTEVMAQQKEVVVAMHEKLEQGTKTLFSMQENERSCMEEEVKELLVKLQVETNKFMQKDEEPTFEHETSVAKANTRMKELQVADPEVEKLQQKMAEIAAKFGIDRVGTPGTYSKRRRLCATRARVGGS